MVSSVRHVFGLSFSAVFALSIACSSSPSGPAPAETEEEEPSAEEDHAPPPVAFPTEPRLLKEPPSANYRVSRRTVSDTCSPKQPGTASRVLGVVTRFSKNAVVANVPVVITPTGFAQARLDVTLTPGKTTETTHSPCEGATSTVRVTVGEVEADDFTILVERTHEGVESCPPENRRPVPSASCASVEELHFEVEDRLCSARCNFQARAEADGTLGGECNCGRQR